MRVGRLLLMLPLAGIMVGTVLEAEDTNDYRVTILASNEPGEAPVFDQKLVNGWGIAAGPTTPWWVSDNGSGWSTLYTGAGAKLPLEVVVPGAPTGMVAYVGSHFPVAPQLPARFIWASEDGTISAWNPNLPDRTHALIEFTEAGSIFKGLAVRGDTLYVTDFAKCRVETIDGTFASVASPGGFADPSIPARYCPFGIQAVGSDIFVTYALKGGTDDVAGVGHGFVREFDAAGHLVARVANHGRLNSPWGVAMAPMDFGEFSGCLLVGNFGDGLINAFCPDEGQGDWHPHGVLREDRHPIVIDGLWGIGFGNGAAAGPTNVLYFAAGPDEETNGYFGKVEVDAGN
jgi:uncharacterized protein (TIGR03118 family)